MLSPLQLRFREETKAAPTGTLRPRIGKTKALSARFATRHNIWYPRNFGLPNGPNELRDWYPSWDPDEEFIIYAHSDLINAYYLRSGVTQQISAAGAPSYRYPNVVGSVK